MPPLSLAAELARYGPQSDAVREPSLAEAEAYCRRLAQTHYENFTVASWLLPRALRRHFYHIYAYCRWADDLADETASPEESRRLLDWWEAQLDDCYRGAVRHPVFVALRDSIGEFALPREPFADLLTAFRQDQVVTRYESIDELLGYCRNSANPVGRLVLCLGRCRDEPCGRLSDSICTGLQLVNFCQDVDRDWQRGRIYLPRQSMSAAGCDEEQFARRQFTPAFRRLMAGEVERAESYLQAGRPLVELAPRELRVDVALFIEGGLAIARAIRRQDYDVWSRRPTLSKVQKLNLLARGWRLGRRSGNGARA